jgi:putative ABC transport system permease protein
MQTMVFGVRPIDPTVMALSCLILGVVAAAASYIPAHRASRLDPAEMLRSA